MRQSSSEVGHDTCDELRPRADDEYRLEFVPYDEDGYDDADYSSADEDDKEFYEYMVNFTRMNFERRGKKMPADHRNPFLMFD